jgi:uncharacterized membrane protein
MMTNVLRAVVALLCCIGLYAAQHMYQKSRRAERGELDEPSIVEEPHARLFFGQPNSLFGCLYFPLLLVGVVLYALLASHGARSALVVRWFVLVALATATGSTIFLAYSLVAVTKRECPFCWTSHVVNVLLFLTVPWTMF